MQSTTVPYDRQTSLSADDRARLIAATEAARQRMQIADRASWLDAERDDGPVHIGGLMRIVLARLGLLPQLQGASRG